MILVYEAPIPGVDDDDVIIPVDIPLSLIPTYEDIAAVDPGIYTCHGCDQPIGWVGYPPAETCGQEIGSVFWAMPWLIQDETGIRVLCKACAEGIEAEAASG